VYIENDYKGPVAKWSGLSVIDNIKGAELLKCNHSPRKLVAHFDHLSELDQGVNLRREHLTLFMTLALPDGEVTRVVAAATKEKYGYEE